MRPAALLPCCAAALLPCCAAGLLLLLASCAAAPADCDLSDPGRLSLCIKQLLLHSRAKVARETDPLRLPNHNDGDLTASNIVIRGIAGYSVDDLSVTFPQAQQIAVIAAIAWPHLRGDLDVRVRECLQVIWEICASVDASPDVTVGRTVGTLTTTLNVDVAADGRITVRASGTNVSLSLASIRVKANVRGAIGFFNQLFGDPASRITTKLANSWWRSNKGKIETKVEDALDKAVREEVSVQLSRLLKL